MIIIEGILEMLIIVAACILMILYFVAELVVLLFTAMIEGLDMLHDKVKEAFRKKNTTDDATDASTTG